MSLVFFSHRPPSVKKTLARAGPKISRALVFCDKRLKSHPLLKKWRTNKKLKFYYISAGEKSKSLERLPAHIKKIMSLSADEGKNSLCFISLGGGSLSDLTGFLASIYQRGLPVIHFPTTWLAALDSAHGGKTAINFQNIKNILGSCHFPQAVFAVQGFLSQNPAKLKREAWGELLKIALIEGGGLYKNLKKALGKKPGRAKQKSRRAMAPQPHSKTAGEWGKIPLERFIRPAIRAKMKIVRQDPFEKKSIRKKLNLGHTVGHILESAHSLPHGLAVLKGLSFSLSWSYRKGFISQSHFNEIKSLIPDLPKKKLRKIPLALFRKHLRRDKKSKSGRALDFVFIKKPGGAFLKTVSKTELVKEARRQGLI